MNMLKTALLAFGIWAVGTIGAAAETIRMAVTDIEGVEMLQREFGAFRDELQKATGFTIEFTPVSNRTAAVEAMRAKQVDFVLTGPAEYVVFRTLTDAKPVIGWQRPDYYPLLVVLAEGPVKSIKDLKGKKVAFGAVGSTSQHLGPAQVLADAGLKYNVDYTPEIIARNVAVEAMIRGDVAAVGMNQTHLQGVRKKFPDVKFAVVGRGPDLPNDILIAASFVPDAVVETIRKTFVDHNDALMAAVLTGDDNQKFKGGHFLPAATDEDYVAVRDMYRTIGVDKFAGFMGD